VSTAACLDELCRVFVHRYRDLDPSIRAECVHAIGLWFKKYPSHFLDGSYLRYVGWVLSDPNTHVRLEAVKSLFGVYQKADYIGSLQHFTDRFKPRLVEMATGDTELSVRVAVIQVLGSIDGHGLLEDEQRETLCLLVFDEEAKVRRAVSRFVRGVWEDMVEERLHSRKAIKQDKARAGVKSLGMLLVRLGKALDKVAVSGDEDDEASPPLGSADGNANSKRLKEVAALVGAEQRGRTALAVEALWDEVDPVSDWEALLDVLLLDHSASGGEGSQGSRGRRTQTRQTNGDSVVDEAWRLEEVEEAILLEVLVAALRKAKMDTAGAKKVCIYNPPIYRGAYT
jgi:cohesin complex subunit SA-1/2